MRWPAGDRHSSSDWSKIGILVDGTDWARGGGQRAGSRGARTGGERPCWKSGGHLSGGQRACGNPRVNHRETWKKRET